MNILTELREMGKIFSEKVTMNYIRNLKRRELSAEEKEKSYSQYFYKEMADIPQSGLDIVNEGPVDPSKAISVYDKNKMMVL